MTLALAVSAVYLAKNTAPSYVPKNLALIFFIIIGTGLGYVIGGLVGRRITRLIQWIDEKTKKISGQQLISGIGGLVIGLVVASLINKPVEAALKPLKIVSPYALTMVYFVLGYLGFTLFVNRHFNFDFTKGPDDYIATQNVLDTSVIIDGRIADVMKTGFIYGEVLIPRFILGELQTIADSSDDIRRAKGRRGLDILQQLRKQSASKVSVIDEDYPSLPVDDRLIKICKDREANLVTNDFNLSKVAVLEGVHVLNINDLASTLKPLVVPGESFSVTVIKEGKEKEQGVGYLDDGTMIVVQNGKDYVGKTVDVTVSSVLQTSAGKMIFANIIE